MKTTAILSNRRGTTLIETLISVTLFSMVMLATVMLLVSSLNVWAKGSSGTSANQYACLALNRLALNVEEGRSASVVEGRLVVVYPYYVTATGDYDRNATGDIVTYYLSGNTGTESTGTNLWKSIANGPKTRLAKHIDTATFNTSNPRTIQILLRGVDREGGSIQPATVRVTIKLRNS